jgi:hypothetical protein
MMTRITSRTLKSEKLGNSLLQNVDKLFIFRVCEVAEFLVDGET